MNVHLLIKTLHVVYKENILSIDRNIFLQRRHGLLRKMYISCTGPSFHNLFSDFLLVKQNSFTTAFPMNCQNKPVLAAWICT